MNDISELVRRIRDRGARKVALQFPSGLKRRSGEISRALEEHGLEVVVCGDPCYGACDLALEALGSADLLVHFGHAPIGGHPRVIFEPWEIPFDVSVLERALPLLREETIGLVTTAQHAALVPAMKDYLRSRGVACRIGGGGGRTPFPGQVLGCNFTAARESGASEILFVGTGLFHPIGIACATAARVVALDPFTGDAQEVSGDQMMRRRFALIEKARTAKTAGIIVSTKSGQQRMDLARYLAGLYDGAVIVTMREVTPDELMNLGFGCYANTACPRLAYDDQVRFPVPVLSPREFEILCGARGWDEFVIDEIV